MDSQFPAKLEWEQYMIDMRGFWDRNNCLYHFEPPTMQVLCLSANEVMWVEALPDEIRISL